MSAGLRLLTSGAAPEDAVLIRSGPLLAASAADWLGGGGSQGLQALAAALYGCVPGIAAGAQAQETQAGSASDPAADGALAAVVYQAASIIDELATKLAGIEHALDEQAHTASRYGVRIGTDRRPPPAFAVPPGDSAAATERYWTHVYAQAHAQATADARGAGHQAVLQLTELQARLAPPRPSLGPSAAAAAGSLTIGQFLTGLSRYLGLGQVTGPTAAAARATARQETG